MRSRLARAAVCGVAAILCGSAAWWLWDHRHYWIENNFRVVEPEKVYAGGYQYPKPLARIVEKHHIKTIVNLRGDDDMHDAQEREVLAAAGVQVHQVVIARGVPVGQKLAAVEEAVAIVADPSNQPVFVHCWAGCHRTGAVIAVYRMRHCGWSEDAARAELRRWGGFSRGELWPDKVLRACCSPQQLAGNDAPGQRE
jgi:protein tyrosine phosphatase (PTP) superfamily phosphohydrolase (DUF442 family)